MCPMRYRDASSTSTDHLMRSRLSPYHLSRIDSLVLLHLRRLFYVGLPRVSVGGGLRGDAEIPDVEIHSFFSQHTFLADDFYQCIFSGRERLGGGEFQPASDDVRDGGFDDVL